MGREQKARRGPTQVRHASATTWREATQPSKAKQNQHKDKSCNLKKHKKSNSRPNRAVWTVFVNCAHWRGSTLAIYKTVLIIFPLNLHTITITLDVVKWRWGEGGGLQLMCWEDHSTLWEPNLLQQATSVNGLATSNHRTSRQYFYKLETDWSLLVVWHITLYKVSGNAARKDGTTHGVHAHEHKINSTKYCTACRAVCVARPHHNLDKSVQSSCTSDSPLVHHKHTVIMSAVHSHQLKKT